MKTTRETKASDIFKWLNDQKYQTEHGDQEYKMYFDVDMPKILNAWVKHLDEQDQSVDADRAITGDVKRIALAFAKWEYPQHSIHPEDFDLFMKQPDYAIKPRIEGYTELVKIMEWGFKGNRIMVDTYATNFIQRFPNHPLSKPFKAILNNEQSHIIHDHLPDVGEVIEPTGRTADEIFAEKLLSNNVAGAIIPTTRIWGAVILAMEAFADQQDQEMKYKIQGGIDDLKISMNHLIEDGADPVYDLKHPVIIETLEQLLKEK